jgi:hypothetical protein
MTRIALLAMALFWSLSAAAQAATATGTRVRVEEEGDVYYVLEVRYAAGGGESNDVTVTFTGEEVAFEDSAAAIEAQGECTNTSPNRAVCSSSDASLSLRPVLLGDGSDQLRIDADASRTIRARGGPGDDRLYGGSDTEYLFAGPGDDLVDGGPGGDTINGGGGRDELRAGELANDFATDFIEDGDEDRSADDDTIVGHPDRTYVTYRARRRRVMIDLAAGVAGARGERDNLVGITLVEGGRAGDLVAGSPADDFIRGNRGADEIRGLGGDDVLRGEGGADHVYGGRGDDVADDSDTDNEVDIHSCGSGYDFVGRTDKRDRLRRSCEDGAWWSVPDALGDQLNRITVRPSISRDQVIFRSTCHDYPRCKGRIRLKTPDRRELLGRGRFQFRRRSNRDPATARRHDVVVDLNERGRERLRRGGYVRVVIVSRYDCLGCLNPPPPVAGLTTRRRRCRGSRSA